MAADIPLDVYGNRASFYSLLVLLALEEKKIPKRLVRYHELGGHDDVTAPWFARINPHMQMPAIKHGDKCIPGSSAIIDYLEDNFPDSVSLRPTPGSPEAERCERVMKIIDTQPDGDEGLSIAYGLTYGSAHNLKYVESPRMPSFVFRFMRNAAHVQESSREAKLRHLADENPDLRHVYLEKIRTSKTRFGVQFTEETYLKYLNLVDEMLEKVEEELKSANSGNTSGNQWVCGTQFSIADIYLVVLLNRIDSVGLSKRLFLTKRPYLTSFFTAYQKRESGHLLHFSYPKMFMKMMFNNTRDRICRHWPILLATGVVVAGIVVYKKYT